MAVLSGFFQGMLSPMFWFQPVFYTFHGWLATEMALWMLFHPYEPKFVPGTRLQLPFTPGIFPRGRKNLSVSIANTITDILLTKEDIKRQARKLITEENLYTAIDALTESILAELRDIGNLRRLYRHVDEWIPLLSARLAEDYIQKLEAGEDKTFRAILSRLFQRTLPHLSLTQEQADFCARLIFDTLLSPASIRQAGIAVLTAENTAVLEDVVRNKVSGMQGILLRFVDLQKAFNQLRQFLVDKPGEAEEVIGQLLERMKLADKLSEGLFTFRVQQLPAETLESLQASLADWGQTLLISHRTEISDTIRQLSGEATQSLTSTLLHLDPGGFSEKWLPGFKRDLAHFAYTYLNKELENMLSRALPAISLNTVIMEKIDQFSARELEETIQRICKRELRWLAFLGAFLGFWLGLVSNLVSYFTPHPGL